MTLTDLLPPGPQGRDADDLYDAFVTWVGKQGITLYPAQEEAVIEVMTGANVILSTPTGSGKTLVATGAHFAAMAQGKRTFYTAPIKALVSEKFFALCDIFGAANVGMMTGDASVNAKAPIICCTAEVLANIALREGRAADAGFVFPGGAAWTLPHWSVVLLQVGTFSLKTFLMGCFLIQIRWTFPRFRYDQLMTFGWKQIGRAHV